MLYLTRNGLSDRAGYENAGISLPEAFARGVKFMYP